MDSLKALLQTSVVSGKAMQTALKWLDKQAEPEQRVRWVRPNLAFRVIVEFPKAAWRLKPHLPQNAGGAVHLGGVHDEHAEHTAH